MDNIVEQFEVEEDLEPTVPVEIIEYDITATPRDYTPANLVEMIDNGMIEIPPFQRNFIWKIKDSSKLIESVILGLPVPELFFYSESDDNTTFKVIDGQQRLLSIYYFIKGRFPKNPTGRVLTRTALSNENDKSIPESILHDNSLFQDFVLDLDNSFYSGKKFTQLEKQTQMKLKLRRALRVVIIRQNKPDNNSSMYEVFHRLNTGGTPLKPQEIRASLYYGKFYELLFNLNQNVGWRKILNNPASNLHGKDTELILRCFALLMKLDSYKPKMKDFLNRYSYESKKFSDAEIDLLRKIFLSFIENCNNLDKKIFFRNARFSAGLLEAVFIAACETSYATKKINIAELENSAIESLKNDEKFSRTLLEGSTSNENIRQRINMAKKLIK